MKKILWLVVVLFTTMTLLATLAPAQEHHTAHWSYNGETGPSHWAGLNPEYAACGNGHEQSPINIAHPVHANLPAIEFHYAAAPLKLINNGHTVQVNYAPGSYISVAGHKYDLVQFHFHHPSEEQVDGKPSDLVIHLVHKDSEGHLAVVAVLFKPGESNAAIKAVVDHVPKTKEQEVATGATIDAGALLPQARNYYTFPGSLTTPPCTEGVRWFVLETPSSLDNAELQALATLYPHNARPVQPLYKRTVQAGQ